jgi:sortase A
MPILRFVGKFLVSLGVGILLFALWMLWGTSISASRAQERLAQEFDRLPHLSASTEAEDTGSALDDLDQPALDQTEGDPIENAPDPLDPPADYRPGPGDPVFQLRIPAIELDQIVVEGVGEDELTLGPGHYPGCRPGFTRPLCTPGSETWPGEVGRVVVSGHRSTYGAPFRDLHQLASGDEIFVGTRWSDFTYVVTRTQVVSPNSTDIGNPDRLRPELVLTTCHPRFSSDFRLRVFASWVEGS